MNWCVGADLNETVTATAAPSLTGHHGPAVSGCKDWFEQPREELRLTLGETTVDSSTPRADQMTDSTASSMWRPSRRSTTRR